VSTKKTTWRAAHYAHFRKIGEPALRAWRSAHIVDRFRTEECAGRVRLNAAPEEESYFDVFGEPNTKEERAEIVRAIERDGLWCISSAVLDADGAAWHVVDSIGMVNGPNPLDPFTSDYVVDLMRAALEALDEQNRAAERIGAALVLLRRARAILRPLAPRAADYVARCIKSADGARRHALGLETRKRFKL
jgi:hypothetical protein